MRWYTLLPLAFMVSCSLLSGGVAGLWESKSGLKVNIAADRSWSATCPASFGTVEMSGQWSLNDQKLSLVPLHWAKHVAFTDMGPSTEFEMKRILGTIESKTFQVEQRDDSYTILRDSSPIDNLTLYPSE